MTVIRQAPFQLRVNSSLTELDPILAGEAMSYCEETASQFSATNETYLLHFVRCGRGLLHFKGQDYPVHAGQIFLLPPGVSFCIHALPSTRWSLRWVAFTGTLASRFSELPVVFDAPPGTFERLCDLNRDTDMLGFHLASELYFLYAKLIRPSKMKPMTDTVEWVKEYIKHNYPKPISVATIATEMGLDPDYLTRKFKKKVNINIQSYILQTRISNAKRYLILGYSIKETATLCGFNDASSFSRSFKKYEGQHFTPSQWQNYITEFHRTRKSP